MKPSPSFLALVIAFVLHALVFGIFWITLGETPDEKLFYKEKRFGITLQEELELTHETLSALKSDNTAPPKKTAKKESLPSQNIDKKILKIEPKPITEAERDTLPFSVLHHYGDEFFTLSAGEQHYIIDNLQKIRKLNEIVGTRLLRERYHDDVDPLDNNVVEFILNPDGSISNLSLEKNRIGTALDELTLQTINLAHPKYPKPEQPTKVRIRVYIIVKE